MAENRSSPMLDQYRRIKREHEGDVLFFRLGDFYEMFAEDAIEISALLNLALTNRNGIPMCGVPYHAARSYIARLLKHGKKIAICEQLSEPGRGQKLIDRQVVEVITPGTTVDEDYLEQGCSNYLAALAVTGAPPLQGVCSFAYIDLSSGGFYATAFPAANSADRLRQELERIQAREMIVQESLLEEEAGIARALHERPGLVLNRWADWLFDPDRSKKRLLRQFNVSSLRGFGLEDSSPQLLCAGALLDYLDDTARSLLPHVRSITVYTDNEFVGIDESSQRNLELVRNMRDGDARFSLLEVLDETRSAMGKRLLRRRVLHPLRSLERIRSRLDMVETLYRDQGSLSAIRELLGRTPDLERLSSRLAMDKAHGKDMLAIKNALFSCKAIRELRDNLGLVCETDAACETDTACETDAAGFAKLMELADLLERGICDDPSILLTEGNLIRAGYSSDLDSIRKLKDSGRQLLEAYLEEEKQASGIPGLKMRYNRLIGYFFEVANAHTGKVPAHFIRRQGIAGGERFSTERLASLETDINSASDKIIDLERRLFLEIREKAKTVLNELAREARRVAETDAAQSLAKAASIRGWTRPEVDDSNALEIYEARHPVVEAQLGSGEFIPNDIILNSGGGGPCFAMITGPNMAGKSTYLRSAALITLMAQIGSFIPASRGRIGLCDRIYCRVGSSDNLARGESTFLVEMNETAYILNTASEKSLVIMDEVGRGTGTNDGLSIAWAVSEELLDRVKCRTFFATHYHELSLLPHPRIVNRSMEVLEKDGGIIFLRKLREGPTAESYGIHVARLAGLSPAVLDRAEQIMDRLRERGVTVSSEQLAVNNEQLSMSNGKIDCVNRQNNLVNDIGSVNREEIQVNRAVLKEIRSLDPNKMTPLDALGLVSEWKQRLAGQAKKPQSGRDSADSTPSLFDTTDA
ncbi:MAG: DNA mismatch repair protein MutS [Treponema sp.]|jgi:DNA mismatch repair protein MutS|nr:DNA mismatch repair protein MutS [Treponema sp.]